MIFGKACCLRKWFQLAQGPNSAHLLQKSWVWIRVRGPTHGFFCFPLTLREPLGSMYWITNFYWRYGIHKIRLLHSLCCLCGLSAMEFTSIGNEGSATLIEVHRALETRAKPIFIKEYQHEANASINHALSGYISPFIFAMYPMSSYKVLTLPEAQDFLPSDEQ